MCFRKGFKLPCGEKEVFQVLEDVVKVGWKRERESVTRWCQERWESYDPSVYLGSAFKDLIPFLAPSAGGEVEGPIAPTWPPKALNSLLLRSSLTPYNRALIVLNIQSNIERTEYWRTILTATSKLEFLQTSQIFSLKLKLIDSISFFFFAFM